MNEMKLRAIRYLVHMLSELKKDESTVENIEARTSLSGYYGQRSEKVSIKIDYYMEFSEEEKEEEQNG